LVIVIVSSNLRERTAFLSLCESRSWPTVACDSVAALRRHIRRSPPGILLVRHKLADGYSDDAIAVLDAANVRPEARIIVLLSPRESSAHEARQIALGADFVLRDPIRTDVLAEYLAKFRKRPPAQSTRAARNSSSSFSFAGAVVEPLERLLRHDRHVCHLTPREVELLETLHESAGKVVNYEALYLDVMGRPFQGDTSNVRVLLSKLDASFRSVGLLVRDHIEVIPKTGYRYNPSAVKVSLAPPERLPRGAASA
jgi:DNA-binding response OmpR family regulator